MARIPSFSINYDLSIEYEGRSSLFGFLRSSRTLSGENQRNGFNLDYNLIPEKIDPDKLVDITTTFMSIITDAGREFEGLYAKAEAEGALPDLNATADRVQKAMLSLKGRDGNSCVRETSTGLDQIRRDFDIFDEVVNYIEDGESGVFMDTKVDFGLSIRTKNIPAGSARFLSRHSLEALKGRGSLPLYKLYPRLYRLQQLYGLTSDAPQSKRLVVHRVVDGDLDGRLAVTGDSSRELATSIARCFDEVPTFVEAGRQVSFVANQHGYQCPERKAFYAHATGKDLTAVVSRALQLA